MKRLCGTVVPLITPLTSDDQVDIPSLERLVEHCISGGLQGLYPCGTTGEMMYLTVEERQLISETVVRQTRGRLPVFIQTGAWNQADTLALSQHAAAIGATGIGVVTPVFYKLSDQGLLAFYQAVAAAVPADFPIYLYSIPQNAVNDISPALASRIAAACPNVVGIKYSYPDMTRLQQLMLIRQGQFSVLAGPDQLFEVVCAAGGDGVVSGNAQCIPEHYASLWQALQQGDYPRATKLQRRTNMLNDIMCAVNNIAAYKVILQAEGVITTTKMRRPMENLRPAQEQALLRQLQAWHYRQVEL